LKSNENPKIIGADMLGLTHVLKPLILTEVKNHSMEQFYNRLKNMRFKA